MVPAGSLAVAHAPNYRELMVRLGRDRFAAQYPDRYDELSQELAKELGFDLFDPGELSRIGIDPDGPVGLAVLDAQSEAFTVYFRLIGGGKFERWLEASVNADGFESTSYTEARLLRARGNDEIAFVLRKDYGAFVFTDRPQRAPRDFAVAMAEGDARRSINHDPRFVRVLAELPRPAHLLWLFDLPSTLDSVMRDDDDASGRAVPLPPSGASQEELEAWEAQQRDVERFVRDDRERRARQRAAIDQTVGDFTALGGAVTLSKGEMALRGVATLHEGSAWRRLFAPGDPPTVLRGLTVKPIFIIGGQLRATEAVRMVDRVASVLGASADELRREFVSEVGVPLDDVAAAFSGDLGLAIVQAAPPKKPDRGALEASFGLVAAGALEDPAAASQLLAAFATHGNNGLRRDQKLDAYVLDKGDWGPTYWAVIGDHFVVTTEKAALRQLRGGVPVPLERHVGDAGLRGLLERPGVGVGYLDALLPALQGVYLPYPIAAVDPVAVHEQLSAQELKKVPKSKRYRAKYREYEQLLRKIDKAQLKRGARALRRAVEAARIVGRGGMSLLLVEPGYVVDARWTFGVDDLAAIVDHVIRSADDDSGDFQAEMGLNERRWELESELRELRMREIEAFLRRRPAP